MQTIDRFGHLYPVINQVACVDCALCRKVCPSIHELPKQKPSDCYAAWAKDSGEYKSSTSGGAAAVLSQHVIMLGGVVYGCAMLPDVEVKHIRVNLVEDLPKLKSSKYVQSDILEVLPLIKQDVKDGRTVLFIGTPCQCAAVRKMFRDQPNNLFLVDLICHGVPSLKYLQDHVKSKTGTIHVDKVLFRDANSSYAMIIVADGEIRYQMPLQARRYEDVYFNTFFDGYTYRASCYNCQYARPERAFDITIGDFWGLGKHSCDDMIPAHPHGCSVIIPNSEKGGLLIKEVKDKLNIYRRTYEEAVDGNHQLQHPFFMSLSIRMFRKLVGWGFPPNIYKLFVLDNIVKSKIKKMIQK